MGRIVLGVAFLVLGVIGLFLPFLQGVLFIVVGLTVLSKESDRARSVLEWMRVRLPLQQQPREKSDGIG